MTCTTHQQHSDAFGRRRDAFALGGVCVATNTFCCAVVIATTARRIHADWLALYIATIRNGTDTTRIYVPFHIIGIIIFGCFCLFLLRVVWLLLR